MEWETETQGMLQMVTLHCLGRNVADHVVSVCVGGGNIVQPLLTLKGQRLTHYLSNSCKKWMKMLHEAHHHKDWTEKDRDCIAGTITISLF